MSMVEKNIFSHIMMEMIFDHYSTFRPYDPVRSLGAYPK